ncbi:(4Fe-4S)-binding protein [Streptomyces sp. NBC_01803]|uniref:(4Fe-4S)-binding protein n=1 Tax=Streptomyces sp. NBC_01803 TaxID=2975946 RepID=UPI002DDB414A|nr:(4Fe-4S)-binding protein [Streptomyces sp. NBC_01803]WSA43309.1 (4Fe-4S)-binding protein [Streptomyces sp. NBC_01803]
MSDAIREYPAPGITVTWEPGRCEHAAECVRGVPAVFDTSRRPWITPEAAPADELAEVIDRCPSFALGYRTADGRTRTAPPA